jgi:hypothetical protein
VQYDAEITEELRQMEVQMKVGPKECGRAWPVTEFPMHVIVIHSHVNSADQSMLASLLQVGNSGVPRPLSENVSSADLAVEVQGAEAAK